MYTATIIAVINIATPAATHSFEICFRLGFGLEFTFFAGVFLGDFLPVRVFPLLVRLVFAILLFVIKYPPRY